MNRFWASTWALVPALVMAQTIEPAEFKVMQPRNIGPAGMSGRITTIDVHPADPDLIYAGSASGGLWKSPNGGTTWEALFTKESISSIGAVALDPSNPSIIWVGTGEGNPRNSQTSGNGIYRSPDGGQTWTRMGLENTKSIHRVIVHPRNSNVVWVAALGTAWGDTPDRGVYKTTDGGKTWTKVLFINNRTGCADLVIDPTNPDKLMAAMWEYRRWPWYFKSGGEGSGLHISHDGGQTWVKRTADDGLPEGQLGRIGLAISPANPQVAYALVENKAKNALFRSDNGGKTWSKASDQPDIGNRPFYYSEIYADPINENKIYSLWTLVTMSNDAGRTWNTIAPYYSVHPDHHAFFIHPTDPDYLIEGNDGGLNISRDGGKTWRFVENLPLAQFYHISYDMAWPYNVYGGMQDNGSWQGPAYVLEQGGIRNSRWREVFFGDGFDVVPDPLEPEFCYAMSQEGYLARVHMASNRSELIRPVHPDGIKLRFNWNAGIAIDPHDQTTVYFGSQFVHRTADRGRTWEIISPDLTTNDTAHQKAHISGGLTWDVTGAENYTTILCISPDLKERDVIWVGTDDGKIHLTRNGGGNWTELSGKLKGLPAGSWIAAIVPSPHQAGEALVVANDYRRNNWDTYLYLTTDYGKTWKRLADGKAVSGHALSAVQDPVEPNLLFLGTEHGLWYSLNKGAKWEKWPETMPTVPVQDMKIHPREGDLILGTFGRAAYVIDDLNPLRAMASGKVTDKPITVFAPQTAYLAYRGKSPDGTRFAADAMFAGENRPGGAIITFRVVPNDKDTTLKKADHVYARIVQSGKVIRTLKWTWKKGLNREGWYLDETGEPYPSRSARPKDADEPGGADVLPGTYKLVLSYGPYKDSTTIQVLGDPRFPDDAQTAVRVQKLQREFEELSGAAATAANNLREAREATDRIAGLIADQKSFKDLSKQTKTMGDSIRKLENLLHGQEDVKGFYDEPETIASKMGLLSYYIGTTYGEPSQATLMLYKQTRLSLEAQLATINAFLQGAWSDYRRTAAGSPLPLFKEPQAVKLN